MTLVNHILVELGARHFDPKTFRPHVNSWDNSTPRPFDPNHVTIRPQIVETFRPQEVYIYLKYIFRLRYKHVIKNNLI